MKSGWQIIKKSMLSLTAFKRIESDPDLIKNCIIGTK